MKRDIQENDEEAVQVKEQSILELGSLLAKTGQAAGKSCKWLYLWCFCLKHQMEFLLEHWTAPNTQFICGIIQFYFPDNLLLFNFVTEKCRIVFYRWGKVLFLLAYNDLWFVSYFELSLYFLPYRLHQSSAISLTSSGIFKESDFRFFIWKKDISFCIQVTHFLWCRMSKT